LKVNSENLEKKNQAFVIKVQELKLNIECEMTKNDTLTNELNVVEKEKKLLCNDHKTVRELMDFESSEKNKEIDLLRKENFALIKSLKCTNEKNTQNIKAMIEKLDLNENSYLKKMENLNIEISILKKQQEKSDKDMSIEEELNTRTKPDCIITF
jgi:hypothetical protein